MRIIATSDLHYNITRSKRPTEHIAREICRVGGDVLLFVGDTATFDGGRGMSDVGCKGERSPSSHPTSHIPHPTSLEAAFGLFESFPGPRLAVAGNHELWTVGGADSLNRYENELAEMCSRCGVHYLDAEPFVMDGLAVVGSVGWYDFSFRPSKLKIPLRFYQHKVAPGAAARLPEHRHLVEQNGDLPPGVLDITTRWMDGVRVRLPMGDSDFTQYTADRLRSQLERVHEKADHVVAAVHHLPFAELVPHSILPNWEFATAFLGSELLGETLLHYPKIRHVLCGHSHRRKTCRKNHLHCTSIGSTYKEKAYEVIEI